MRSPRRRSTIARAALGLGASLLATGVDHLQQYYSDDYSTVPTIGTRCFGSAVIVAVGLVAPLGRVAGRSADAIRALFAVGAIGIAVLSLAALFVAAVGTTGPTVRSQLLDELDE
jgi:hypothetical protein